VINLYSRRYLMVFIIILALLIGWFPAGAADIIIVPEDEQRPEKQTYDKNECHNWAVRQSGIDPNRAWMEEADEYHQVYEEQNKRDTWIFTTDGFIGSGPYWETTADKDRQTPEEIEQEREHKQTVRSKQSEKYYRLIKECMEKRDYSVEIKY